ncbi:UNVERIFIED_CONTAM: hypothetical protein FKN15_055285 [Acipenser sinensis]
MNESAQVPAMALARDPRKSRSRQPGKRITQAAAIDTQAEGGHEPGTFRTNAQRRYRCTKTQARYTLLAKKPALLYNGKRITQAAAIDTQAEGGHEPGTFRTNAQRRYRCTKTQARYTLLAKKPALLYNGKRITQAAAIDTQAEGGHEPGTFRTNAQRRYRCTKTQARYTLLAKKPALLYNGIGAML